MTKHAESRATGIACGLVSSLIWGAFPVVTRLGLTHTALDSYDITLIRFGVSGVLLLPYLMATGLRGLRWREILLLVVGIGAPYMLTIAVGLRQAPVEQFAVVTPASMIVFSTSMSVILLKTRLTLPEMAGIALIVVGVLLSGFHEFSGTGSKISTYLIFVSGGFLWSVYTVSAKRFSTSALHATAIVSVFSIIGYFPFYLCFRGFHLLHVSIRDIGLQAVYQGMLVSIVALFFYSKSVQMLGAAIGSTFAALVPGAAILLAAIILREVPQPTAIAGLAVVTIGMLLTLVGGRIVLRLKSGVT
jgi:drug/metabolite transporter (DMT)-like permease